MRTKLVLLAVACWLGSAFAPPVRAHSWYPHQCCSGMDCAPVLSELPAPDGRDGKYVTSMHGTVFVPRSFSRQASRDHQAHVCMRPDIWRRGVMLLLCYFEPGTS